MEQTGTGDYEIWSGAVHHCRAASNCAANDSEVLKCQIMEVNNGKLRDVAVVSGFKQRGLTNGDENGNSTKNCKSRNEAVRTSSCWADTSCNDSERKSFKKRIPG